MKLGLVLNVVDPLIGGVLLMGHRGTGKSTAVRALADLLPPLARVKGCAFGCDPGDAATACRQCAERHEAGRLPVEKARVPVIDLPLGATEDRVCGSLDIERALRDGVKAFEPGLLARANRGFLYIDEVNLLEDHLVNLLLDVSASGRNVVEREGISVAHPARFVLVGSGNPEEGEIRPQLLDRFGLYVYVETAGSLEARVEIMRRRDRFERDAAAFHAEMAAEQDHLRRNVARARRLLPEVGIAPDLMARIAGLCLELNIAGHRGELTILRAAKALAALEGQKLVTAGEIRRVATMSLRHRVRREVHGELDFGIRIGHALEHAFPEAEAEPGSDSRAPRPSGSSRTDQEVILPAVDSLRPPDIYDQQATKPNGKPFHRPGRGHADSPAMSSAGLPRRAGVVRGHTGARCISMAATLRAAAPRQRLRQAEDRPPGIRVRIHPEDLRSKRPKRDERLLVILAVDASGSMALNRVREAKGVAQRLLRDAYCRRHKIAVITFRAAGAQLVLPPGRSVERANCAMDYLAVGGDTPLAAGIHAALDLMRRTRRSESRESLLVLLTDGCANRALDGSAAPRDEIWRELAEAGAQVRAEAIASVVIDTRQPLLARGEGERLATLLGARHVRLPSLDAGKVCDRVVGAIKDARSAAREPQ